MSARNFSRKMDMVQKIQEILISSKTELENTIKNVEKQFTEFSKRIESDIKQNEDRITSEIKKYISDNVVKAEKVTQCLGDKDKAVSKLKEDTQNALTKASEIFHMKIKDVNGNMEGAFEKIEKFYKESQANIIKIIEESHNDPIVMTKKLSEQAEPLQKQFTAIREEIAKNLKASYEKSQLILKELEANVNNIEINSKKKYNLIVQRFKNCINS